ncbi:hypothetical protein [uncultured Desulfobacter sp.]|uniref:hypothetical protein n=1 Tax=uncultured Desulfobacter sp. TaxID=240139 RepID=UPI0029F56ECB|nr:hypothetical protein [uncultured Desulfobacter sp.]
MNFMQQQGRVVKPARGEQGAGISVDISEPGELETAIERAGVICSDILILC